MTRLYSLPRRLVISAILVLGVINGVGLIVMPWLVGHPDWLAERLSHFTGGEVHIERVDAQWHPLKPHFRLRGVTLGTGKDALKLEQASFDLGLYDMVRSGELTLGRISAAALRLHLKRLPDGTLELLGLGKPKGQRDADGWAFPLRLHLTDSQLIWEDQLTGTPPMALDHANLVVSNLRGHLRVRAEAKLKGSPKTSLHLAIDLKLQRDGSPRTGTAYVRIKNFDRPDLIAEHLPDEYALPDMNADLETWAHWRNGIFLGADAHVDARNLALSTRWGQVDLDKLSGYARLVLREGEARLEITQFTLTRGGRTWPVGRIQLQELADAEHRELSLSADFLRVEDLSAFALVEPPNEAWANWLNGLRPRGEIRDLRVYWRPREQHWRVSTVATGIGVDAWQGVPALERIDAELQADESGARMILDTRNASLNFANVSRWPHKIERLQGQIDWVREGQGWSIRSEELTLRTPNLDSRWRLYVRVEPDKPTWVDAQTSFKLASVDAISLFLPKGIMRPRLIDWFDTALLSGSPTQSSILLHGPIADFPFDERRSGRFEALLGLEDTAVRFNPEWPDLRELTADLHFVNNTLDLDISHGRFMDSRVRHANFWFPQLDPTLPTRLRGRLSGPLSDAHRLFTETPLKTRFGEVAKRVRLGGRADLLLDTRIELDLPGKPLLKGKVSLKRATATLPRHDLVLKELSGDIAFDLEGVRSDNLVATVLGHETRLKLAPLASGTSVQASARLPVALIDERLSRMDLSRAYGEGLFNLQVRMPGLKAPADAPTKLLLNSDLRGIGIDLPPPLGKKPGERRDMALELSFRGPRLTELRLEHPGLMSTVAQPTADGNGVRRAAVSIGAGPADLPEAEEIRVDLRLAELDLAPWLAMRDKEQPKRSAPSKLPPLVVNAQVGLLRGFNTELRNVGIRASQQPTGLRAALNSHRFAGTIDLPRKKGAALVVALDYCRFPAPDPKPKPATGPDLPSKVQPTAWPAIELSCKSLELGPERLGSVFLKANRSSDGLDIQSLGIDGPNITLHASGSWLQGSPHASSSLHGSLDTPDAAALFKSLGMPQPLKDASAEFHWSLRWPGDPSQLGATPLSGELRLDTSAGTLTEVDIGAGRLLGLLNFGGLIRRLRFDFRDLKAGGYAFDRIHGKFKLINGIAHTDDLQIKNTQAKISIKGDIDLMYERLDQRIEVIPKLDATIPIASTIAGGPIAGLVALLAQQTLKKPIDQINRFEFAVSGGWDDPKVERLNGGGPLSGLLGGGVAKPKRKLDVDVQTDPRVDAHPAE